MLVAWVHSEWLVSGFGIPLPCYWLMELLNCVPLMVHWNIHHFSQAYILKYATPGYDTLQLCVNYKHWLLVMRHSCFSAMCIVFHFDWQWYVDAVQYVSPLPLPCTTGTLVPSLVICHILVMLHFWQPLLVAKLGSIVKLCLGIFHDWSVSAQKYGNNNHNH